MMGWSPLDTAAEDHVVVLPHSLIYLYHNHLEMLSTAVEITFCNHPLLKYFVVAHATQFLFMVLSTQILAYASFMMPTPNACLPTLEILSVSSPLQF